MLSSLWEEGLLRRAGPQSQPQVAQALLHLWSVRALSTFSLFYRICRSLHMVFNCLRSFIFSLFHVSFVHSFMSSSIFSVAFPIFLCPQLYVVLNLLGGLPHLSLSTALCRPQSSRWPSPSFFVHSFMSSSIFSVAFPIFLCPQLYVVLNLLGGLPHLSLSTALCRPQSSRWPSVSYFVSFMSSSIFSVAFPTALCRPSIFSVAFPILLCPQLYVVLNLLGGLPHLSLSTALCRPSIFSVAFPIFLCPQLYVVLNLLGGLPHLSLSTALCRPSIFLVAFPILLCPPSCIQRWLSLEGCFFSCVRTTSVCVYVLHP